MDPRLECNLMLRWLGWHQMLVHLYLWPVWNKFLHFFTFIANKECDSRCYPLCFYTNKQTRQRGPFVQFSVTSLHQAGNKASRVYFILCFMCFCADEWVSMILTLPGLGAWISAMLKTHACAEGLLMAVLRGGDWIASTTLRSYSFHCVWD